jgi:hypothetical protein
MSAPTHDLVIKTGEYTDRITGETKARWLTIGSVFRHDDGGTSIKLDCVPVGLPEWNGWVSVYSRKGKDEQPSQARQPVHRNAGANGGGQRQAPRQAPADFDDDIPF